jgi:hypothetical protein
MVSGVPQIFVDVGVGKNGWWLLLLLARLQRDGTDTIIAHRFTPPLCTPNTGS